MALAGTMHFLAPKPFVGIVPRQLPARYALVYASGAVELTCAAGLVVPRTRRKAGWATVALLVAVFPANIQMAVDALRHAHSVGYRAGTIARLPLQIPLIGWAISVSRGANASAGRRPAR